MANVAYFHGNFFIFMVIDQKVFSNNGWPQFHEKKIDCDNYYLLWQLLISNFFLENDQ